MSLLSTIRDLHRRRARERRGLTLAEGVRLIEEALAAGLPIRGAVTSQALKLHPGVRRSRRGCSVPMCPWKGLMRTR